MSNLNDQIKIFIPQKSLNIVNNLFQQLISFKIILILLNYSRILDFRSVRSLLGTTVLFFGEGDSTERKIVQLKILYKQFAPLVNHHTYMFAPSEHF